MTRPTRLPSCTRPCSAFACPPAFQRIFGRSDFTLYRVQAQSLGLELAALQTGSNRSRVCSQFRPPFCHHGFMLQHVHAQKLHAGMSRNASPGNRTEAVSIRPASWGGIRCMCASKFETTTMMPDHGTNQHMPGAAQPPPFNTFRQGARFLTATTTGCGYDCRSSIAGAA